MDNDYKTITPLSTQALRTRRKQLRIVNARFDRHILAYPPTTTHLRRLAVEVNDHEGDAGWRQVERFWPQLKELELHIVDNGWGDHGLCGHEYLGEDGPLDCPRAIDGRYPAECGRVLPATRSLTKLSIQATGAALQYLAELARSLYDLQELSLGIHWASGDSHARSVDASLYAIDGPEEYLPLWPNMQRLTVIGNCTSIKDIIHVVKPSCPNLFHLIVYFAGDKHFDPDDKDELQAIGLLEAVNLCESLKGLAFYGPYVNHLLSFITVCSGSGDPVRHVEAVRMLVLDATLLEPDDDPYPLLDVPRDDMPDFSHLRRVSWIVPPESRLEGRVWAVADWSASEPSIYDHIGAHLRKLFLFYGALKQVQWVAGYPKDPFALDTPANRIAQNVIYVVDRPETMDGKLGPLELQRTRPG